MGESAIPHAHTAKPELRTGQMERRVAGSAIVLPLSVRRADRTENPRLLLLVSMTGAIVNNHPKVTPIYQLKFPPLG
jgi:hypothetical protein